MTEYLNIGIINNFHGIKGYVKVTPLTDDIKRYGKLDYIFLKRNEIEKMKIEEVKYSKNTVIIKFEDINNIDEAKKLKNLYVMIEKTDAIKLPKDSFFICDLIDCEVYDYKEGLLGRVVDIIQTGSNDVYIVKDCNGKERLVPALKKVICKVDILNKRIEISLLEGL